MGLGFAIPISIIGLGTGLSIIMRILSWFGLARTDFGLSAN
jgi:hypothetical protein